MNYSIFDINFDCTRKVIREVQYIHSYNFFFPYYRYITTAPAQPNWVWVKFTKLHLIPWNLAVLMVAAQSGEEHMKVPKLHCTANKQNWQQKINYKPSRDLDTATEWTVEKGWSKETAGFLHHVCSTEYYWKKGVATYLNLWINLSWEHILQHKYQDTSETHNFCNHSPICDSFHSNSVNEEESTKAIAGSFNFMHCF